MEHTPYTTDVEEQAARLANLIGGQPVWHSLDGGAIEIGQPDARVKMQLGFLLEATDLAVEEAYDAALNLEA